MKTIRVSGILCSLLLVVGCGNQEPAQDTQSKTSVQDVKEELQGAVETVGKFTEDKVAEYQKSLDAKLQTLNEKHEKLESRMKEAGKEAKDEMNATLADLRSKKEAVKTKLHNLQNSTGKAWEEMGSGVEGAMKDLEEGYDQALKEFSS